jgi:ubiquitin-activating enzyme E1
VRAETEVLFNDDFYDSLTGVCTALDNVEARLYMDQRCLFYKVSGRGAWLVGITPL